MRQQTHTPTASHNTVVDRAAGQIRLLKQRSSRCSHVWRRQPKHQRQGPGQVHSQLVHSCSPWPVLASHDAVSASGTNRPLILWAHVAKGERGRAEALYHMDWLRSDQREGSASLADTRGSSYGYGGTSPVRGSHPTARRPLSRPRGPSFARAKVARCSS